MPGPAPSVYSPLSRCGIPTQNSMTSMPRWMSPRASASVLPCSSDSSSASSSPASLTRSMKRIITRARRCGFHAAQPFWASTVEATYLVVGAGAMGMAFIDTLVTETSANSATSATSAAGARVVLVDRNHQPGGHWTMAYPFVRLHQPSAFYGVNSRDLGSGTIDQAGWNSGLFELATAGEVCAYYDHIMRQQLLPTGRVS